jgi:hypothetical protein
MSRPLGILSSARRGRAQTVRALPQPPTGSGRRRLIKSALALAGGIAGQDCGRFRDPTLFRVNVCGGHEVLPVVERERATPLAFDGRASCCRGGLGSYCDGHERVSDLLDPQRLAVRTDHGGVAAVVVVSLPAGGSESSAWSTRAGSSELNSSTIVRVRAIHRGQWLSASQRARSAMLRPQRGQTR